VKKIYFWLLIFSVSLIFIQCKSNEEIKMKNVKDIAYRFYNEVLNKGDLNLLPEIMTENFIDYNSDSKQHGIEGFKEFLQMVSTAFPDLRIEVNDVLAENNKVTARLTISGTQTGDLGTIPPSNKKAVWTGIDILEIKDNKIAGRWSERNLLSLMKQIGAI
jgi:steroid delta-isomerase-like uncharacterized protein